jgi:mRNA-degrading endonuclease RelE of RelBE toxin-antitoxin system
LTNIPEIGINQKMTWNVRITKKAEKQAAKLPKRILETLYVLMASIREFGPVRGDWPSYSKLPGNKHHCHLKKGKPTYVAVWTETKETITVEIIYAGTHEKAPY